MNAKIVKQAKAYAWGSLWNWNSGDSVIELSTWPVMRLPRWIERVNEPLAEDEMRAVQNCIQRGSPYGTEEWVNKTARKEVLESTLRPRGRPRLRD